ncbi:MAG: sulfatase-like hydrolase/transferase, partial [SAR324 cluster bacterium]|nr:sulfatase-like hydrolase/transferase [SAR324 cluster bacterium]
MSKTVLLLISCLLWSCWQAFAAAAAPPNIVLILADDLGFSDIQPYGSEIETPNICKLADEGLLFTNYHTAATCSPTRGMLLTGVDSHRNGVPNIPETAPTDLGKYSNYTDGLNRNVVTIATLLKDAGYHTYMAGKWHLGQKPHQLPSQRGFERTLALMDSGADNWEQKTFMPAYPKASWFADGKEAKLPEDFYSSRYFVDKTIEFIESNREDGRPFLAYLPFQAVHIPVQSPRAFSDKYLGKYDDGWQKLRERRLELAKNLKRVP